MWSASVRAWQQRSLRIQYAALRRCKTTTTTTTTRTQPHGHFWGCWRIPLPSIETALAFSSSSSSTRPRPTPTPAAATSSSSSSSSSTDSSTRSGKDSDSALDSPSLFFANAQEYPDFGSLGLQSQRLRRALEENEELSRPSAVQVAVWKEFGLQSQMIIGAETGSGKTLAYLLPLVDDILTQKEKGQAVRIRYDYARALLLVPNKELAHQVIRMTCQYCCGVAVDPHSNEETQDNDDDDDEEPTVRVGLIPGGLDGPPDYRPFRVGRGLDLCVSTPAALSAWGKSPKYMDFFLQIPTLVLDEADMLLDGGYIRELEQVLLGFRRADKALRRNDNASGGGGAWEDDDDDDPPNNGEASIPETQYIFCAATLPNVGPKSVDAFLQRQFPYAQRVALPGWHQARHSGLRQATEWIAESQNRQRLQHLVQYLQHHKKEKAMIFLNSVQDVEGATLALRRAGLTAVPYHAKLSLTERAENLQTFRDSSPDDDDDDPMVVLVCTDLASRGLDIPHVTLVVQLQFATNVVAHLHRMGRCGRAGRVQGRGLVYYHAKTEGDLVRVVQQAEQDAAPSLELQGQDVEFLEESDEEQQHATPMRGSVQGAFSRRRGFTKKRKKERRKQQERQYEEEEGDEEEEGY